MHHHIVILGAGHAGGSAAALLRQYGWKGPITLIGEEHSPPYQRPPLSKTWLTGGADANSILLRHAAFYPANDIELRLGCRATHIDRQRHTVSLDQGGSVPYDELIIALGARPRWLDIPGSDLAGVLTLRTVADASKLKSSLGPGRKLLVIGGGYIGLEVAASARTLGTEVAVFEQEPSLLARVASPILSDFFRDHHRANGVQIELNARVEALEGTRGRVEAARVSDGRLIHAETVLIAIGITANDELARAAGLACDDGILVDQAARTSDTAIYAIGDCTHRPLPLYARIARLESVPNALEQAKQAAADLCGRKPPTPEAGQKDRGAMLTATDHRRTASWRLF
jgi:3-phenylpropionate/trans-cinnamate dioxygenase ferredoxin reductase subunit